MSLLPQQNWQMARAALTNKETSMHPTLTAIAAITLTVVTTPALAGGPFDFNASPFNYQNSEFNYDNSPYNYRNSPYNFDNSPYNYGSQNGVFDNSGRRIGYEVQSPSGVINIFDNQGNRIGYQPARRR